MADEVISGRGQNIVLKGLNSGLILEKKINGADIYPGCVITGVGETSALDIDLASTGECALGIVLEHFIDDGDPTNNRDTLDIDTVYVNNSTVRIAPIGTGMVCLCLVAGQTTTTAIEPGQKLCIDATVPGKLGRPTFSTTTAELNVDWASEVGRSIEYDAGGSDVRVLAVLI